MLQFSTRRIIFLVACISTSAQYVYVDNSYGNQYIVERSCETSTELAEVSNSRIQIGVSAVLSGDNGPFETNTNAGTLIALKEINSDQSLLNGITLDVIFADDAGEFSRAFLAGFCLGHRGVPIIVGPTYSDACIGGATIARTTGTPIISPSCSAISLSERDSVIGFPSFNRIFPSDDFQTQLLASFAREMGWKQVTTMSIIRDTYSNGLSVAFNRVCDENNISVLAQPQISLSATDDDILSALAVIRTTGSRILYMFMYVEQMKQILPIADKLGMIGPEWVWIGCDAWFAQVTNIGIGTNPLYLNGMFGTVAYMDKTSSKWTHFNTQWHNVDTTSSPEFEFISSGENTIAPMDPPYGNDAFGNVWTAYNYDAIWFAAKVLDNVITHNGGDVLAVNDAEKVLDAIRSTKMDGVTGPIALTADGDLMGVYELQNVVEGVVRKAGVWTLEAGFAWEKHSPLTFYDGTTDIPQDVIFECEKKDFGYSLSACDAASKFVVSFDWKPETWKDGRSSGKLLCVGGEKLPQRQILDCDHVTGDSNTGIVIITISTIGTIICSLICVGIFHWRKCPIFQLSQPIFLGLSGLGAVICCSQNLLIIGELSDARCSSSIWLINIGFTVLFAPLLCKTYRVDKVMNNKALRKIQMSNKEVLSMVAVFIIIEVGILSIWQIVDPVKLVYTNWNTSYGGVDALDRTSTVMFGSCDDRRGLFGNIDLIWKISYVLFGCRLGWKTRTFNSSLAESKYIMVAMYQIAVLGVLTLLLFSMGVSPAAKAMLATITSTVGACGAIVLIVGPKIHRRHESKFSIQSTLMTSNVNNTGNSSSETASGNMDEPIKKDILIADLENKLRTLEAELASTKQRLDRTEE